VADDQNTIFLESLDEPVNKVLFSGAVGMFLSLFMIVFQPFGVTNYDPAFQIDPEFALTMLAFGALVTLVLSLNEFLLRPLLIRNPGRKSLAAWLLWTYILTGSVTFLLYNAFGNWHDFHWSSWIGFLRDVAMVISFPVVGFLFTCDTARCIRNTLGYRPHPARPAPNR